MHRKVKNLVKQETELNRNCSDSNSFLEQVSVNRNSGLEKFYERY
jgi:hypothetical protein